MDIDGELANPALDDLRFLVGEWTTIISNASFFAVRTQIVTGRMVVTPIEAGMFLALRQAADTDGPPLASWVIGRDGSQPGYTVLYSDSRGVSRVYAMSLANRRWAMWRDDPEFSQRFEATVRTDGHSLEGRWERRSTSGEWEHDFDIAYSRR